MARIPATPLPYSERVQRTADLATTATQDVDLWFESVDDPRIGEALGDRFDVVVHMHGLNEFAKEFEDAKSLTVDGIPVRVLPLERIIASKRALGRARDLAQIPALEEALAAIKDDKPRR